MINIFKLIWLKSIFSKNINNCKIRIYNKIIYYEIYITYYSKMCKGVRKTINDILKKYKQDSCVTGHGNIIFNVNKILDKNEICKIIFEITKLFSDENTEIIEFIEIDNFGNLIIKPKNLTFENINKIESEVKWNNEKKYIFSYIPVKVNYNLILEDIVNVIYKEYNIILKNNKETLDKINHDDIINELKILHSKK